MIDNIDYTSLHQLIVRYPKEDTVVNLSGGDRLYGLLALAICQEEGYRAVFADLDEEKILDFSGEACEEMELSYLEPDVEDFIGGAGGDIRDESSTHLDDPGMVQLLDCIAKNLWLWDKLTKILTNSKRRNGNEFTIWLSNIRNACQYKCFLDTAVGGDLIDVISRDDTLLKIKCKHPGYHLLLDKNELPRVLAYHEIKKMEDIDDIKYKVKFAWDQDDPRVCDKADILASAGGRLIYINFRKRLRYPTGQLNEMSISSVQIGGKDVVRVLVLPDHLQLDTRVTERMQIMGVKLIKFNNDPNKLKAQLINIIREA
jgi:hypothetical protein